jgi:hypothetical protein
MPADTATGTNGRPAQRKPNKRRARVTIDKRYALGRRAKQLTAIFRARLGADADDPMMDAAIRRAAELMALAEDMRARMFKGEPGALPDDVVRMQRLADISVGRLQLDRHKPASSGPSLADLLHEYEAGP